MKWQTLASIVEEIPDATPVHTERYLFPSAKPSQPREDTTSAHLAEEAYQRGLSEGSAAAQREIESATAAFDLQLQEALAAQRQQLLDGEGQRLAASLVDAIASLEAAIIDKVTPVLHHLLETAVVDRAMADLSKLLRKAVSGGDQHKIRVSGSAALIGAIKSHLPPNWQFAEFIVSETANISVATGGAEMEFDLEKWQQTIAGGVL